MELFHVGQRLTNGTVVVSIDESESVVVLSSTWPRRVQAWLRRFWRTWGTRYSWRG